MNVLKARPPSFVVLADINCFNERIEASTEMTNCLLWNANRAKQMTRNPQVQSKRKEDMDVIIWFSVHSKISFV